jgi:hypothetical protein
MTYSPASPFVGGEQPGHLGHHRVGRGVVEAEEAFGEQFAVPHVQSER